MNPLLVLLLAVTLGQADASVRYNEAQFKAAHNSVDRAESVTQQLDTDPDKPHQGGCRGVEFDVVLDPASIKTDTWRFGVQHGGEFEATSPSLRKLLGEVKAWSTGHPRHTVITVYIDLKSGACIGDDLEFVGQIDGILAETLGRTALYRPGQMQHDQPTLRAGLRKHGWPTLKDLRGKFIVVFSGDDRDEDLFRRKLVYVTTEPTKRLAFADRDVRNAGTGRWSESDVRNPYYNTGWHVFVLLQRGRPGWLELGRAAHDAGLAGRVWVLNDPDSFAAARDAGINILATDKVRGAPWTAQAVRR